MMSTNCQDKVLTLPQVAGTCWFNAVLYALFYSQGMRRVLKLKQPIWTEEGNSKKSSWLSGVYPDNKEMMKTMMYRFFSHMYKELYQASTKEQRTAFYSFMDIFRPEIILTFLHNASPSDFYFKPGALPFGTRGWQAEWYVGSMLRLLLQFAKVCNTTSTFKHSTVLQ